MVKEQGYSVDTVMNPVHGIRDQMRRAGVEPKNHMNEQKQRLRALAMQKDIE